MTAETKSAILAIWSAQVAAARRMVPVCKTAEARHTIAFSILAARRAILGIIEGSDDAWDAPGSTSATVADILRDDLNAISAQILEAE